MQIILLEHPLVLAHLLKFGEQEILKRYYRYLALGIAVFDAQLKIVEYPSAIRSQLGANQLLNPTVACF